MLFLRNGTAFHLIFDVRQVELHLVVADLLLQKVLNISDPLVYIIGPNVKCLLREHSL